MSVNYYRIVDNLGFKAKACLSPVCVYKLRLTLYESSGLRPWTPSSSSKASSTLSCLTSAWICSSRGTRRRLKMSLSVNTNTPSEGRFVFWVFLDALSVQETVGARVIDWISASRDRLGYVSPNKKNTIWQPLGPQSARIRWCIDVAWLTWCGEQTLCSAETHSLFALLIHHAVDRQHLRLQG